MPGDFDLRYKFNIDDLTRGINVHVTVANYRGWLVRLKIALLCFRLGAWIAGVGIRVDDIPQHLPECGTLYRGCAPDCPKRVSEERAEANRVAE